MNNKVNVFMIGAPKCGTTSIANSLSLHEDINVSNPKESYYFSTDITEKGQFRGSLDDYHKRFYDFNSENLVYIDASTHTFLSDCAIKNILDYNPNAKFIIFLRDPKDMIISWHSQMLVSGQEDVEDFEEAWRLSELRRNGESIPKFNTDNKLLDYKEISKLGTKTVSRLDEIGDNDILIITMSQVIKTPKFVMESIQTFLGVEVKDIVIKKNNERKKFKNKSLMYIFNWLRKLKDTVPIARDFRFQGRFDKLIYKNSEKPHLRPEFEAELDNFLEIERDILRNNAKILENKL